MNRYQSLFSERHIADIENTLDNQSYSIYLNPSISEIANIYKEAKQNSDEPLRRVVRLIIPEDKPQDVYVAYYKILHDDIGDKLKIKKYHGLIYNFDSRILSETETHHGDKKELEHVVNNNTYINNTFHGYKLKI